MLQSLNAGTSKLLWVNEYKKGYFAAMERREEEGMLVGQRLAHERLNALHRSEVKVIINSSMQSSEGIVQSPQLHRSVDLGK